MKDSLGAVNRLPDPLRFSDVAFDEFKMRARRRNYGSRILGYVHPPVSGNYIFWIASDNDSELWLSTDENPANKARIAFVNGWTDPREWTKFASQQSVPISLTAGRRYYIEALHKEGLSGDRVAVGWQLPDGTLERPIPGSRLSPAP